MGHPSTRGHLDGSSAVVGGELVPAGEPGDVTGVPDQRTGDYRADPEHLGERGARGGDGHLDALFGLSQLAVEMADVCQELEGQLVASALGGRR